MLRNVEVLAPLPPRRCLGGWIVFWPWPIKREHEINALRFAQSFYLGSWGLGWCDQLVVSFQFQNPRNGFLQRFFAIATCHVLQQDMEVVQVDLKARRATVSVKELTCQPSMYSSFCLGSMSCLQDVEQALQGSRVPLEEATKGRFQTHETFISDGRYDMFIW